MVRIGVAGIGNMGLRHALTISDGNITNAVLTAVCDIDEEKCKAAALSSDANSDETVNWYCSFEEMIASGDIDGVIIATPHYSHPELAVMAFNAGIHVLVEKPAGVYTSQVKEMNRIAAGSGKTFSIMYNQRTNPLYKYLRDMIYDGTLGSIKRINWIITDWYRPQSYYNAGGWRATWAGEGGGVLLNQCPHQLDLWQWIFGMPSKLRAFCHFGKYHDIEVEDDVTAYMEYENGATGVFITSTGDAPGTNRLEVAGEMGKVVIENVKLIFHRLEISEREFNRTYSGGFGSPDSKAVNIDISGEGTEHKGIIQNWVNAITDNEKLISPGEEGIHGLTLSNAMLLSTWEDNWVDLPIDEEIFLKHLNMRR